MYLFCATSVKVMKFSALRMLIPQPDLNLKHGSTLDRLTVGNLLQLSVSLFSYHFRVERIMPTSELP